MLQCVGQFNISPGSVVNHTNACLRAVNDRLSGLIHLPRNEAEVREAQASFNQEGTDHSVCPGFMAAGDGSLVQVGAGQYVLRTRQRVHECVAASSRRGPGCGIQQRAHRHDLCKHNTRALLCGVTCAELCPHAHPDLMRTRSRRSSMVSAEFSISGEGGSGHKATLTFGEQQFW